jgi:hypothetical protein
MKLLMFNTREFWYRTYQKMVGSVETEDREEQVKEALVIFVNVEKVDEERMDAVVRKAVDNITWLAKKTGRTAIVLHSFAHLSDSKSDIGFARDLFARLRDRLAEKGYAVTMTPFGYLNEFRIQVLGESLAKVWKSI